MARVKKADGAGKTWMTGAKKKEGRRNNTEITLKLPWKRQAAAN